MNLPIKTMMMFILEQLGYRVPTLLVCIVGFALVWVYLLRRPAVLHLTLLGLGLIVFDKIAVIAVNTYYYQRPLNSGEERLLIQNVFKIVGITSSVLQALALALLLAAIFVGRTRPVITDESSSAPASSDERESRPEK